MPEGKRPKPKQSPETAPSRPARARVVAFGVAFVALAVLAYVAFARRPTANLARSVPADASLFLELPSVSRAFASLAMMQVFDPADTDPEQTVVDAASAIASALHFPQDDADALRRAIVGVAVVGRVEDGELRHAWLASASSSSPLDVLFASSRFSADGSFARTGKAYRVAAASPRKDAPLVERWLREQATGAGTKLVWFPGLRLLAMGDEHLLHDVADVVEAGAPALDALASFQATRKDAGKDGAGVEGLLFADERALRGVRAAAAWRPVLDAMLRDGGTVAGALRMTPAGLVARATLPLTGDALPGGVSRAGAASLTFPDRLPVDTVFYLASDLRRGLAPAEAREQVLRMAGSLRTGIAFDLGQSLADLERATGLAVGDLFEMAGDEAALAVFLTKDFRYSLSTPLLRTGIESAGVVFAMKVDGDAAAQRVLAKVRAALAETEMGKLSTITADGAGFVASPVASAHARLTGLSGDALPTLRVRYANKEVVVILARAELADHALAALDGAGATLKDDPAHALARKALRPDARLYAWLDVGRVASLVYAANPGASEDAKARGLPVDAVTLAGPRRVTQAIDLDYRGNGGAWTVAIEALNPWAPALLTGWLVVPERERHGSAQPSAVPPPGATPEDPAHAGGLDDMPQCKEVLEKLEQCARKAATTEARDALLLDEAQKRATYLHTPAPDRAQQNKACKGPLFKLHSNPACQ